MDKSVQSYIVIPVDKGCSTFDDYYEIDSEGIYRLPPLLIHAIQTSFSS